MYFTLGWVASILRADQNPMTTFRTYRSMDWALAPLLCVRGSGA